jgi:hypothetical protein
VHGPVWLAENPHLPPCDAGFIQLFMEHMSFLWIAQTEAILPVHIVGLELNPNRLPDDEIMCLGLVERMAGWCRWFGCPKLVQCTIY